MENIKVEDESILKYHTVCEICGGTPCDWIFLGDDIIHKVKQEIDLNKNIRNIVMSNKEIRKEAYKTYVYEKYGFLGKGNRVKCPDCVTESIHKMWPDPNNEYMGYKSE